MKSPNKLYTLLILLCIGGYSLVLYNWFSPVADATQSNVCIFKTVTDVPCPACGSTRSVLAILKGHFREGLYLNPLGYLSVTVLLIVPFWIFGDLIFKKKSLFNFVNRASAKIAQKPYAILSVVFILLNWIWNINKGL